jgi:hypothetical protein
LRPSDRCPSPRCGSPSPRAKAPRPDHRSSCDHTQRSSRNAPCLLGHGTVPGGDLLWTSNPPSSHHRLGKEVHWL